MLPPHYTQLRYHLFVDCTVVSISRKMYQKILKVFNINIKKSGNQLAIKITLAAYRSRKTKQLL